MSGYGFNSTAYDNENRLTGWNRSDGQKNQSWLLSHVGDWNTFTENQTTQNRTHDAVHELTAIDQTALTHDAKGNLTTDANAQTYTWDFDNRLVSATVGADTHGYTYDALGRRVSKTVMTGGGTGGQATATTVFVCDSEQEVAEYEANALASAPLRKYVYSGGYVDEPLMLVDRTAAGSVGAGTDEKFYYHQNNQYSVAALTNQTGSVVERYAYSAYGEPVFLDSVGQLLGTQASTVGNDYLYTGRRLDPESGLMYYRARMYGPRLGRFMSRDPLEYWAGDSNLYRYVENCPTLAVDPLGLDTIVHKTVKVPIGPISEAVAALFKKQGIAAGDVDFHVTYNLDSCTASSTYTANLPTIDFKVKEIGAVVLAWDVYSAASADWENCGKNDKGEECRRCVVKHHYSVTRKLTVAGVMIPFKAIPLTTDDVTAGSCVPKK